MPKVTFDKARWSADSDGTWLSLHLTSGDAKAIVSEIKAGAYDADIKKHRAKRSLDANAYAWVLIGKLAEYYHISPVEVYREQIKNIGGNYEVVPVRVDAAGRWREIWESNGLGWVCLSLGNSKIQGYENLACYYGSSVYDTAQMSRLIDLLVDECKEAGIETLSQSELALLKEGVKNS